MPPSLRLRLALALTVAIILVAIGAGAAAFYTILDETHDEQDSLLMMGDVINLGARML